MLAERCILKGLKAAGVVAGDVEKMVSARIGALFMPHGVQQPPPCAPEHISGLTCGAVGAPLVPCETKLALLWQWNLSWYALCICKLPCMPFCVYPSSMKSVLAQICRFLAIYPVQRHWKCSISWLQSLLSS